LAPYIPKLTLEEADSNYCVNKERIERFGFVTGMLAGHWN